MRRLLPLGLCISLAACPRDEMVWIEPDSTADSLVFGFGRRPGGEPLRSFGTLRVFRCGGPEVGAGAEWVIGRESGSPRVQRLRYGQSPPPGLAVYEGPSPLEEGCYIARATTGGLVEFEITSDGSVRVREVD